MKDDTMEPKKEMALITMKEYKSLVRKSMRLDQLECVGVDNWNGYSEYSSITGIDGWQEIEDAVEECHAKLYLGD